MGPAPPPGPRRLAWLDLDGVAPTGATVHDGRPSPAATLALVQYPGDEGVYLVHDDRDGLEVADTYHADLEDARAQAAWKVGPAVSGRWVWGDP